METNYRVSSDIKDSIPILVVEGDITSESDSDVMKMYSTIKDKHHPASLIINFEKTNYINSAGIATLINIIQDMGEKNGKVSFVGLSNHFQKVMDIVGISDFVDIVNTNDQALTKIKSRV